MIFVSAALVLAFLVALILPSVLCGKKSSGSVVSSAKKTDNNGIDKEETAEESEDSDEPTHSEE